MVKRKIVRGKSAGNSCSRTVTGPDMANAAWALWRRI